MSQMMQRKRYNSTSYKKKVNEVTQEDLENVLDKQHKITVSIYKNKLPQKNKHYEIIRDIEKNGFSFTLRELLHAIGSKLSFYPTNDHDECLRNALLYLNNLDFNSESIRFHRGISHDLISNRSHEIGIGFTCLFVSRFFGIHPHELQDIPIGPGKRFDYRGKNGPVEAIFEAKGTIQKRFQSKQMKKGLKQKKAHHKRGEHFDIELIICTHVGFEEDEEPSIMIADPNFSLWEFCFSPHMCNFYRYRHFARVMQFIGLPKIARQIYLDAEYMRKRLKIRPFRKLKKPEGMDIENIGGSPFVGRWFNRWVPENSKRYNNLLNKETWLEEDEYQILVYQGLHMDIYESLSIKDLLEVKPTIFDDANPREAFMDDGIKASVFSDGTAMAFALVKI